jgi:uncharacterized coiled-coil protein SlyX
LEQAFHEHQAQRDADMKSSAARFTAIETRFDALEVKAVKAMQYHVDTSKSMSIFQTQMDQMMGMLQEMHHPRQSHQSTRTPPAGTQGHSTSTTQQDVTTDSICLRPWEKEQLC